MGTLGSPLDTLALLNYGFLTAVNNVWTWLAVITAAVSFWRLKFSSLSPPPSKTRVKSSSNPPAPLRDISPAEPASISGKVVNKTSFCKENTKSVIEEKTKGKFTTYFNGEDGIDGINGVHNCEDDGVSNCNGDGWFGCWERVMEMRSGELGWYRYLDLTVIDGNVVRLWDGGCRRRSDAALAAAEKVVGTWW